MKLASSPARVALGALLAIGLALAAAPPSAANAASDQPFIVKVHADWCGTCTALEPTWKKIEAEYQGKARLVVFDVSNKKTLEESRTTAKLLGLTAVLDEYKGSTGTIAVLDPYGNTVAVMKGELDFAAYKDAIAKAGAS